jgi:endo-1,4-beta-xylanase
MGDQRPSSEVTRRSFLRGIGAAALASMVGCTTGSSSDRPRNGPSVTGSVPPSVAPPSVAPIDCDGAGSGSGRMPLWATAIGSGIVYGSSAATWQLSDRAYRRLFARETAIVFTEDDLLWWRLRPTPRSELDFTYADRLVDFAEEQRLAILGAHLVWDEGFGEGWSDADLWELDPADAAELLYGTIDATVERYAGRIGAWIVANEVIDGDGVRVDVPWYATIGPSYVEESFRRAHDADPDALLLLNDFGFETDDDSALAEDKRASALALLDELLAADVPVHGLGVQAHLAADGFADAFDAEAYRTFLAEVASRGLDIMITELDVLDDGVPAEVGPRDAAVADALGTYLDVALDEPAVGTVVTFGLSDRYTWLQEDYPRTDGEARRPLPFDEDLEPKPAFEALETALASAARREPPILPARC